MELHVTCTVESAAGIQQTRTLCEHFQFSKQLKQYVKSLLDLGVTNITCPHCRQAWAWQEVRAVALLTNRDQSLYEKKLSWMTRDNTESFKKCPGCSSLLQRLDLENLCMECPLCSETRGETFQFCWACLSKWKGASPQAGSCTDESCHIVALLQGCALISNRALTVHGCPSIRACPSCRVLLAHSGGCKYVTCKNCSNHFCYRCLDSFDVCYTAQPNWYHQPRCAKPLAARQTFASGKDTCPHCHSAASLSADPSLGPPPLSGQAW
ncbi:E3 ubiquitin-protein ligase RNF144A-like [Pristis pectinata]|uniref:E3 ubiquitin-protein ligase RNF144A-like n=1 Tax=Pristis pectinata TaxID=685728 RepID=UPI00223CCA64|nr:E3 ubiquitin-protein ligase RNF144A-like [Pristis pectinata]